MRLICLYGSALAAGIFFGCSDKQPSKPDADPAQSFHPSLPDDGGSGRGRDVPNPDNRDNGGHGGEPRNPGEGGDENRVGNGQKPEDPPPGSTGGDSDGQD